MEYADNWVTSTFGPGLEAALRPDGYVAVRHVTGGPVLLFTGSEWEAFLKGIQAGEFSDLPKPA